MINLRQRTCRVLNMRDFKGTPLPATAYYIGRASKTSVGRYGNEFVISEHGTRDQVCDQYDAQLMERLKDPAFEAQMMRDLDQKDLVCWCTQPNRFVRCHGHSLLREIGRRSKRPELYCS